MKIKLFYYVCSGGDGSAFPRFFSTKEKRDAWAAIEEEREDSDAFCDADGEITLDISETGAVTSEGGFFDEVNEEEAY